MEYRCISADCHVDLCWLPYDLFVSNATPAMKEHMPYVVHGPEGPNWVTKSGIDLGYANGKGSPGALGAHGKYIPGKQPRCDRMAATGLYADGMEGKFRPTTPSLRLQDQERDGIQAEILYGLLGAGNKITERDVAAEFFRIYNDWLFDFCSHNPQRFVGLASIPSRGVEEAVAETVRVAKLGLRGIEISYSWNMTPLWNPYWDPLWKAASETNLPVHFHTINPRPSVEIQDDTPQHLRVIANATRLAGFQMYMTNILAALINGGALERYPDLRVVLGESGIGWIPYVLERMDSEYEDRFKGDLPLKMKPSEYWRRQCRATFQNDPVGAKLLGDLGVENAMWGSDYPHADGVFPDSQEYIHRQFGHLPSDTQRKITCENAGKFYGLIPS